MNVVQAGRDQIQLVSSGSTEPGNKDLMKISYRRVQKNSPEFATIYESTDQSVDVQLSTFIFHAAPEPVVTLYDFIMTTFVPQTQEQAVNKTPSVIAIADEGGPPLPTKAMETIRVSVKLDSVQGQSYVGTINSVLTACPVMLLNDFSSLATLSLSTADVQLLLRANTMRITGRLGSLALSDDRSKELIEPGFKQILSIEGKNFAEFRYQTLDPAETSNLGVNSTVSLNVGSLKVHFLEQPLHDIYLFVTKLAKLKVLYDAARDAAVQRASEIERMQFDISVKTPIIVFPSDPSRLQDILVMRLGEISARNSYEGDTSKITASLCGIQLVSDIFYDGEPSMLKIVDDIDIVADVIQTGGIDRSQDSELPDTQVAYPCYCDDLSNTKYRL